MVQSFIRPIGTILSFSVQSTDINFQRLCSNSSEKLHLTKRGTKPLQSHTINNHRISSHSDFGGASFSSSLTSFKVSTQLPMKIKLLNRFTLLMKMTYPIISTFMWVAFFLVQWNYACNPLVHRRLPSGTFGRKVIYCLKCKERTELVNVVGGYYELGRLITMFRCHQFYRGYYPL